MMLVFIKNYVLAFIFVFIMLIGVCVIFTGTEGLLEYLTIEWKNCLLWTSIPAFCLAVHNYRKQCKDIG